MVSSSRLFGVSLLLIVKTPLDGVVADNEILLGKFKSLLYTLIFTCTFSIVFTISSNVSTCIVSS